MADKLMDRPLPSLAQWLGDGARGEGFEEWVKEAVFLERNVASEAERSAVRIQRTLSIAFMEVLRAETEQHGREWAASVMLASRVAGAAAFGAVLGCLDADKSPPLLRLARMVADEFHVGAKSMAKAAIRTNAIEKETA